MSWHRALPLPRCLPFSAWEVIVVGACLPVIAFARSSRLGLCVSFWAGSHSSRAVDDVTWCVPAYVLCGCCPPLVGVSPPACAVSAALTHRALHPHLSGLRLLGRFSTCIFGFLLSVIFSILSSSDVVILDFLFVLSVLSSRGSVL